MLPKIESRAGRRDLSANRVVGWHGNCYACACYSYGLASADGLPWVRRKSEKSLAVRKRCLLREPLCHIKIEGWLNETTGADMETKTYPIIRRFRGSVLVETGPNVVFCIDLDRNTGKFVVTETECGDAVPSKLIETETAEDAIYWAQQIARMRKMG